MGIAEDLAWFLDHLEAEGVRALVVGGMALHTFGVPRATLDVDLQIDAEPPGTGVSTYLGLIVEERTRDEVFDQEVLIGHRPTHAVPFELFFVDHWFTRQALERGDRVSSEALGLELPVPTVEDFVLLKLAYATSKTRSPRKANQDLLDLDGVVDGHRDRLDRAFLRENAERLGLTDALDDLLA